MKVLHVATTNARGGAENHLADLIRGQLADGWEVQVAFLKGDGYWTQAFEDSRTANVVRHVVEPANNRVSTGLAAA